MKRVVALCLCLLVASCTSVPTAQVRISHTADPAPAAAGVGTLLIEVDGRAIDWLPAGWGSPLASRSTLITGFGNELKAASPSVAETVLVHRGGNLPEPGNDPEFGRVGRIASARALVPAGCSAVLAIEPFLTPGAADPALELVIHASADRPTFLLRAARRATEEEAMLGHVSATDIQTLRVDWPLEGAEGEFMLAVAATDRIERATLWRLRVRAIKDQDPEAAEAQELSASLRTQTPHDSRAAALARSLRQAKGVHETRAAFAFAAVDSGSPLTAEVAAIADDKALLVLVHAAAESLDKPGIDDVSWHLDRTTLVALGKVHADNALDRGVAAMLSARFGEVGRDVPNLARLAGASATRADMDKRLRAEHLILLDDSSPATRVRAFDWLAERKSAPAGYDPLGPARARRDAVERHVQTLEARP